MTVFYLVRHAYAKWTPDEARPLSSKGHLDAERVADTLLELPIDSIVSSPWARARQTVEPLAARTGLPIREIWDLRERELNDGVPLKDFEAALRQSWLDPSFALPGGESNAAAQSRGVAVIRRLVEEHSGQHVVVGGHGNLLALILQHFDPSVDYAFWKSLTNPDIYCLQFNDQDEIFIERLWDDEN
jgi:2,3-bisphosphoglycerate-dependent phosphoglycerate mutase